MRGPAGSRPCALWRFGPHWGYCGDGDTLDRALSDFAESYGDQTERDHAELVKAIKAGRVKAVLVGESE